MTRLANNKQKVLYKSRNGLKHKIRPMGFWCSQGQPIPEIGKLPNWPYSSKLS